MTKIAANATEGDILAVIRELEDKKMPTPPNPAELREKLQGKLEFVAIVEKTNLRDLVEGCFGKTADDIKRELQTALDDLDGMIAS